MAGSDRRQRPRYALSLRVTIHPAGGGQSVVGVSQDISARGIFVATEALLAEGQRVELLIHTEEVGLLVMQGNVVHALPQVGVGVEFLPPNPRTQSRLEALLEQAKKSQAS